MLTMNKKRTENSNPGSADSCRFMVVGLGNPGRSHRHNRHNLGFMVLDEFAARYGIKVTRVKSHALIGSGKIKNRSVIPVKPMTYMNLSGRAIGPLCRYFRIPLTNLMVIYDEIDLPFGVIRIRASGGSGGHNGMKSIIQDLGRGFPRIRIGIGRPTGQMEPADYVLQNFSEEEGIAVEGILKRAVDAVDLYLMDGVNAAMNLSNRDAEF